MSRFSPLCSQIQCINLALIADKTIYMFFRSAPTDAYSNTIYILHAVVKLGVEKYSLHYYHELYYEEVLK